MLDFFFCFRLNWVLYGFFYCEWFLVGLFFFPWWCCRSFWLGCLTFLSLSVELGTHSDPTPLRPVVKWTSIFPGYNPHGFHLFWTLSLYCLFKIWFYYYWFYNICWFWNVFYFFFRSIRLLSVWMIVLVKFTGKMRLFLQMNFVLHYLLWMLKCNKIIFGLFVHWWMLIPKITIFIAMIEENFQPSYLHFSNYNEIFNPLKNPKYLYPVLGTGLTHLIVD